MQMSRCIYRSCLISAAAMASAMLAACDEGKIYPDDTVVGSSGMSVTVKGTFQGCSGYENSDYGIVVAAFKDGDDFAVVSKPLADGSDDIVLKNVDPTVSTVEVCVISRLRERVFTVASMAVSPSAGTDLTFNAGDLDVAPFAVISSQIFTTTCAQCHGATGTAAARLDLMPGAAYGDLVNVPSTVVEGEMRVKPGDASASTLWQAVATDVSELWKFDHSNLLTSVKYDFIREWINSGADDK